MSVVLSTIKEPFFTCDKKCCTVKVSEYSSPFFREWRHNAKKAGIFFYDPKENKVLLVQSRGLFWGPPKGTIEFAETIEECAVRETREETGLEVTPKEFLDSRRIKNKATYYFVNRSATDDIEIQNTKENDANGITWIKLECLQEEVKKGRMIINQHCRILLKQFLRFDIGESDFVRVESSKRPFRRYYKESPKDKKNGQEDQPQLS